MENSLIISAIIKIISEIKNAYKHSIFKKKLAWIKNTFKRLSRGSLIISFFTSDKEVLGQSLAYRIYGILLDKLYLWIKRIQKLAKRFKKGSIILTFCSAFKARNQVQPAFSIFFMAFGLTAFLINFRMGVTLNKNLVFILILCLAFINFSGRTQVEKALKDSLVFGIIKDIFTIDKEGYGRW